MRSLKTVVGVLGIAIASMAVSYSCGVMLGILEAPRMAAGIGSGAIGIGFGFLLYIFSDL